jgi:hypothetical protein
VRIVFAAVHKATGDPVATFRTDSVTQGLHPAKRPPAQRPAQCRSSPRSRQLRVEGPDRSSGTSNSKRAALGGQTHDATQRATGKSSIHAQHLEPRARHELATYFCELPSSPSAVMHHRVSRSWKTWPVTHFVHR